MGGLKVCLDELDRPSRDIHRHLTDAANLDAQSEDEFLQKAPSDWTTHHSILKG